MKKYFAFDPDNGLEEFDTIEEAKARAQTIIDEYRDCCDPEWPDEVQFISVGMILHTVKRVDIPVEEHDGMSDNFCDYVLEDVAQ